MTKRNTLFKLKALISSAVAIALLLAGEPSPYAAEIGKPSGCGGDTYCLALLMGNVLANSMPPTKGDTAKAHCKKHFSDPELAQTCYGYYNAIRLSDIQMDFDKDGKRSLAESSDALTQQKNDIGVVSCDEISTEGDGRWAHAICKASIQFQLKNCGTVGIPERKDNAHFLSGTLCHCMQISHQSMSSQQKQNLISKTVESTLKRIEKAKATVDTSNLLNACLSLEKFTNLGALRQDPDYICFKDQIETAPLKAEELKPVVEAAKKVEDAAPTKRPLPIPSKKAPLVPLDENTAPQGAKKSPRPLPTPPPPKKTDSQREWDEIDKKVQEIEKNAGGG